MDERIDPRFALNDDTIKRGREHIAELRNRWARSPTVQTPRRVDHSPTGTSIDDLTPEQIATEMGIAAERDGLSARITQLEHENAKLKAALGAVLQAASSAFERPEDISRNKGT